MNTRLVRLSLLFLFAVNSSIPAQVTAPQPELVGLVHLAERKPRAWFVVRDNRHPGSVPEMLELGDGERVGNWEVMRIDLAAATVHVRAGGVELNLQLNDSAAAQAGTPVLPPYSLRTRKAELGVVLSLYAEATGRTVLQHPALPAPLFNLDAPPGSREDTVHLLEDVLSTNGIGTIRDGERFTLVVPKEDVARETPLARAPKPGNTANATSSAIQAGDINFPKVDLSQVIHIYGELRGRKLVGPPPSFGAPAVVLKTQTATSKEEVRYAFETHFRWRNLAIVDVGADSFKAVAIK